MARTDTRQIIERAAIATLAEYGLDGFTASRLAEFAGVSKANLYHHYSSLDEIMLASFERLVADMQMMQPPEDIDFETWLIGFGEEIISMSPFARAATRAYLAYFTRALGDEKLRVSVTRAILHEHEKLVKIFRRWDIQAGSPPDADALARLILVGADGFLLHVNLMGGQAGELRPAWAIFAHSLVQLRSKL